MISAYNRDVSRRKALRKRRIAREIYPYSETDYYDNLHQYSKNKIHCSCPICSAKTRNKGRRRKRDKNYHRGINYNKSDLLKQIEMDGQMEEAGFAVPQRRVKEWI